MIEPTADHAALPAPTVSPAGDAPEAETPAHIIPPLWALPEQKGNPYTAYVYQVYYNFPGSPDWHLWKQTRVKVGALSIWGHPNRIEALHWISCLAEEYDDYTCAIREVAVTTCAESMLYETLKVADALSLLQGETPPVYTAEPAPTPAQYVEVLEIKPPNQYQLRCKVCGNFWYAATLGGCDICGGVPANAPRKNDPTHVSYLPAPPPEPDTIVIVGPDPRSREEGYIPPC